VYIININNKGLLNLLTTLLPWKSAVDMLWKKLKEDSNFGNLEKVSKQVILCGERERRRKKNNKKK
jgi:hypothetical protein